MRTALPDPTRRHPTKQPGVYYRLVANGDRRYCISYTDSAGKRIWKTVPGNLKDAVQARNEVTRRMHKGERVVQSKMTVKDLADDYLKTQTGHLKESTLGAYEYSIDHYILPRIGGRRVASVDAASVAELIVQLRGSQLSAWTIRGCLTPLSRMFQYAKRRGLCSTNPVAELDRNERPKGGAKPMRILSSDEIQQTIASATDTYKTLLATAIFSGLRLGELLRLEWKDVDLLEGAVTVRESKTAAGLRQVVIPDFLVQMLAKASLEDGEGTVFNTHLGTPMKHRRVNRALDETLKRGKVQHVRFHDLRHTFASLLIGQGEDVTYVADQMGHSSPEVTLRIYAKLFDPESRRREARERMQKNFGAVV